MAKKPEPNRVTEFLFTVAEAVAEVGQGAVADMRGRWEEAWFGKSITPERSESVAEQLGWVEPAAKRVGLAFEDLCNEFKKERESRPEPAHEHGQDHDFDR